MHERPPFIILALPRSRTAWLSAFLSYGQKRCGHDIAAESNSVPDFLTRLSKLDGTVETGAVLGWKLIRRFIPTATVLVVKRSVAEVKHSLAQFGIVPIDGELEARSAMLDECAASEGVTEIEYGQLNDPDVCAWIFETCLGVGFDRRWYTKLARRNIQIDVLAQMGRLRERREAMERFKRDVAMAVSEIEHGEPCLA